MSLFLIRDHGRNCKLSIGKRDMNPAAQASSSNADGVAVTAFRHSQGGNHSRQPLIPYRGPPTSGPSPTAGADAGSDLSAPVADGIADPGIGMGGGGVIGCDMFIPGADGGGGVTIGAGTGAVIGGAGAGTADAPAPGSANPAGGTPAPGPAGNGTNAPAGGDAPGCGAQTPPYGGVFSTPILGG
jgi:hypothetical protein